MLRTSLVLSGIILSALSSAPLAHSFAPIFADDREPYPTYVVPGPITAGYLYVGELSGYPDTFSVTLLEPSELSVELRQLRTGVPQPFSLLAVAEESGGGVREVLRQSPSRSSWEPTYDATLGLGLYTRTRTSTPLPAGTYRIEVSAPENEGVYLLTIGPAPASAGYGASLANIRRVHALLDVSPLTMLRSTYILYPLGGLLVLSGILFVWWHRRRRYDR